jgi:branched-chain amino acid transport system permease protein
MISELLFFMEVLVAGLLSGTMYSLVALGFVLIYKASSTFNFAQGAMVFFAVLSFVGLMEFGIPFSVAFVLTIFLMIAVGLATERLVSKRRYFINGNDWFGICLRRISSSSLGSGGTKIRFRN